jgi:hypothetical protein
VSNVQIPNLPVAIALNGTEALEAVQSGTSVQTTVARIAQYSYAYYPGFYISQLPAASSVNSTDIFPVVQGSTGPNTGTAYKATVAQLFTSPTFTGTTTLGSNFANYLTITGAANTGVFDTSAPVLQAAGAATNMDVKLLGKGPNGRLNTTKLYVGNTTDRAGADNASLVNWKARMTYATTGEPGWRAGGSYSGTVTSGQAFYNQIAIDADTVDPTTGSGPQGTHGLFVGHAVSAGAKGGRTALSSFLNITGAITAGSSGSTASYYVGAGATSASSASAGGSAGNGRGNLFGGNWIATLASGATFWNSIIGGELTITAATGSSTYYKNGFQIVLGGNDAVAGTGGFDAGLLFGQGIGGASPGWNIGISFGHALGWWPINSTGTLIGTIASTGGLGPAYAAAYGVDFSAVTFSTAAFKSTGFEVDGIGRTTGSAFILTSGGPRIVQGTGVPSVLLVLAKGSLYLRNDGAVGSTLYVSQGGGTWNAVAGV